MARASAAAGNAPSPDPFPPSRSRGRGSGHGARSRRERATAGLEAGYAALSRYDSLGRVTAQNDPDAGNWTYVYDDAGRLTSQTDAKSQTTTLSYDTPVGRLASRTNAAGTVSYTYSQVRGSYANKGRLTTLTSPADTLQIDYDSLGRVAKQDRLIGTTHYVVTKTYDAGGLVSIAYPDGDTVGPMQYDGAGRVSSISGILTSVVYDALGRPTSQTNGNGTQTSWSYLDPRGFLSRIQTTGSAGTIQDLQYTQYTDAGLLQQVTSPTGGEGWSYAYDDLNHLTTATNLTNGADSQSYTYDAGDRILTSSRYGGYTYPAVGSPRPHGPTSVGGTALTYDANGNTLGAGGGYWSLTWNADNRLSQTTLGGVTATFSYGGDGDRVKKTSSLGTSVYPFGDDYEITGGVTTKYISVDGLGVVAKRVGTGTGAVTYWLHADRLGSIQAVTNTAGAIVFRRQYRPYGETLAQSGSHTESRGWIDQRNDGESGLTYLHARYFAPQLGVFVSPDPAGVEGGMNQYAYGLGDPIDGSDRSGLGPDLIFCYPQPCNGGGGPGGGGVYYPGGPGYPGEPTSVPRPDYTDQTVKAILCSMFGVFCGRSPTSDMWGPNNALPQQGPPQDRGASIPAHPTGPVAGTPTTDVEPTPPLPPPPPPPPPPGGGAPVHPKPDPQRPPGAWADGRGQRFYDCALAYYGVDPLSARGLGTGGKWAVILAGAGGIPKSFAEERLGIHVVKFAGDASEYTSVIRLWSIYDRRIRPTAIFAKRWTGVIAAASAVVDVGYISTCTAID